MKRLAYILISSMILLAGCGEKVDLEKPVAQIKEDVQTMSVEDLTDQAESYQKAIANKLKELEPLKDSLSSTALQDQMGEKGQELRETMAALDKDIKALQERLQVYLDALKEQGVAVDQFLK